MALQSTESYNAKNKILAGVCGLRSPVSRTLDPTLVTADANGKKHFLPGQFYGAAGDKCRPLPRTTITGFGSPPAGLSAIVPDASPFVVGDEMYVIPPMARIVIAAVWAADDTLEVVIGGQSYTYTSDTAAVADIATAVAAGINSDLSLSPLVTALSSGGGVWIYSKDFQAPYTIAVTATTAGTGTATIENGYTVLQSYQGLGALTAVDADANEITWGVSPTTSICEGLPIGAISTPLGMSVSEIDLTDASTMQDEIIGLYTAASVQSEVVLPYWDGELARLFDIDFAN